MYFQKFPYPANFVFPDNLEAPFAVGGKSRQLGVQARSYKNGISRLTVNGPAWETNFSQARFDLHPATDSPVALQLTHGPADFVWRDAEGNTRLKTVSGRAFGVSAEGFCMTFALNGSESFYGLGEKFLGLELSGKQTKFWNTDVVGDFPQSQLLSGRCDPAYVSIPYLIMRTSHGWVGILINNPGAVFINTGAAIAIEGLQETDSPYEKCLVIGAPHGQPDCFFLFADTLAELTRHYQKMVGTTPLPPAWALGYHQCRWGYKSLADLRDLKNRFAAERIPVSGLWLDIDYMDGYRVFTLHADHFPDAESGLADVQKDGQKVIPIIDPGVKREPGYAVFESGRKADVFCQNTVGGPFIGQVWPGETAFPDFSEKEARQWWSDHVETFARLGFQGCWNDMNDPSIGPIDHDEMLFGKGSLPHWTYHNQFANGMAEATRNGFLAARPGQRPFVLSRSGYTGIARHAAIWTGDSVSNYHWLRMAIPASLNLALSGVPFNGPDVGGFCDDSNRQLFLDWLKACFLFPFCRNHTAIHTRPQEPWAFGEEATPIAAHFIRLRYLLRPYLYQLFVAQEQAGEAILRPLFYDFEDTEQVKLGTLEDQFMIGPAILQAPVLTEERRDRIVVLPDARWWDFLAGKWIEGNQQISLAPHEWETPLYARAGSIVPMTRTLPETHSWDGSCPTFHLFFQADHPARSQMDYHNDDGETFDYHQGKTSRLQLTVEVRDRILEINTEQTSEGYGTISEDFVLYSSFERVLLNGQEVFPHPFSWECMRHSQPVWQITK